MGTGVCGGMGITLLVDNWHKPTLVAADPPAYRSNFLEYTALQMWVRCSDPTAWEVLSVQFSRWVSSSSGDIGFSPVVMLFPHAESTAEALAGNFTRVRINLLDHFVTDGWSLGGVEQLVFNTDSLNRQCVIDNVALLDLVRPTLIGGVEIHSSDIISIDVSKSPDRNSAKVFSNFALSTVDSPAVNGTIQVVHPIDVGTLVQVAGWNDENSILSSNRLYLKFRSPFVVNRTYSLACGEGFQDSAFNALVPTVKNFTYTDDVIVDSIQVNQEGYTRYSSKIAFVNGYFTDMGSSVYIVGSNATIYYRDKFTMQWVAMMTPESVQHVSLFAVAALSESNAYAVGENGTILHYDGNGAFQWTVCDVVFPETEMPISPSHVVASSLFAIDFGLSGNGVIVGSVGVVLYLPFGESDWVPFPQYPSDSLLTREHILRSAYVSYDDAIGIGGDGVLFQYSVGVGWSLPATVPADVFGRLNSTACICGTRHWGGLDFTLALGSGGSNHYYRYGRVYSPYMPSPSVFSKVNWEGCWQNSGAYMQVVVVGNMGSIRVVQYDGSYANVSDSAGAASIYYDVKCVTHLDCIAAGTDGVVSSGGIASSDKWHNTPIAAAASAGVTFHGVGVVAPGSLRLSQQQKTVDLVTAVDGAQSTVAASFNLTLRRSNDPLAGGDVWTVDFSSFVTPGVFKLKIQGLGTSFSFRIGDEALNDAAWHSCRSLFYSRDGSSQKVPPYADPRWSHPIAHEFNTTPGGRRIDAAYHWSLENSPLYAGEVTCPLSATSCPDASMKDMAGGWFDAGDYSKYVLNTCPTVWRLLNGYDMFPHQYGDDWNLPESGNGVPDVLDEVQWELDWLEKMQAADGGVYDKVASEVWEHGYPHESNLGGSFPVRYILEKGTAVTAITGAVFAQAHRVYKPFDSARADVYLERAMDAHRFLLAHPTDVPVGGFKNPPGHISGPYYDNNDKDNRCWLAAELFRSTCNTTFAEQFETLYDANHCYIGWNDFQMHGLRALWAYYFSGCPSYEYGEGLGSYRSKIEATMKSHFTSLVAQSQGNAYRGTSRMNVYSWINFGAFSMIHAAQDLILGAYVFPEERAVYEEVMTRQVDIALGTNPLSQSYITGLGKKQVMHPLHWASRWNRSATPTPGINVFGVASHMPNSNAFYAAAQSDANNFPFRNSDDAPYPVLRRFTDDFYLVQNTEFGINTLGPQCTLLMHLKNATFSALAAPTDAPTFHVSDDLISPFLRAHYRWEGHNESGSIEYSLKAPPECCEANISAASGFCHCSGWCECYTVD